MLFFSLCFYFVFYIQGSPQISMILGCLLAYIEKGNLVENAKVDWKVSPQVWLAIPGLTACWLGLSQGTPVVWVFWGFSSWEAHVPQAKIFLPPAGLPSLWAGGGWSSRSAWMSFSRVLLYSYVWHLPAQQPFLSASLEKKPLPYPRAGVLPTAAESGRVLRISLPLLPIFTQSFCVEPPLLFWGYRM